MLNNHVIYFTCDAARPYEIHFLFFPNNIFYSWIVIYWNSVFPLILSLESLCNVCVWVLFLHVSSLCWHFLSLQILSTLWQQNLQNSRSPDAQKLFRSCSALSSTVRNECHSFFCRLCRLLGQPLWHAWIVWEGAEVWRTIGPTC